MQKNIVGVVMGSDSDWEVMRKAVDILTELNIATEVRIISAHRTPHEAATYASSAQERGLVAIVAGAGRAAHLPGVLASYTLLPVIGVPISGGPLSGTDALYAMVQMPPGVPVATMAIDGALNAGLFAASMIAGTDSAVANALHAYRDNMAAKVRQKDALLQQQLGRC